MSKSPVDLPRYTIDDLLQLMARLRDPDTGCPWDIRQDFASLVPFTIEEVYEVVDTIERGDYSHLGEELGDLLFCCVNLARHAGLDAETVLRHATLKFEGRFNVMEALLASRGEHFDDRDAEALDALWREAKDALAQDKGGG